MSFWKEIDSTKFFSCELMLFGTAHQTIEYPEYLKEFTKSYYIVLRGLIQFIFSKF